MQRSMSVAACFVDRYSFLSTTDESTDRWMSLALRRLMQLINATLQSLILSALTQQNSKSDNEDEKSYKNTYA